MSRFKQITPLGTSKPADPQKPPPKPTMPKPGTYTVEDLGRSGIRKVPTKGGYK